MARSPLYPVAILVAVGVLSGGCRSGSAARSSAVDRDGKIFKHASETAKGNARTVSESAGAAGLGAYFAEATPSRRSFQQFELGRRGSGPRAYEREVQADGRVEGSLIGRVEFPLEQYLDRHSRGVARPKLAWPTAKGRKLDAFFIEFRPAVMEWPVQGGEGEPVELRAQITAYEHDGVPFANGTLRRRMHVAGHESIRVGEQNFDDAVRMEADTELTFGWLANIRVHETAWFARGVGLVRREERFNGKALWLFRFAGGSKYELAEQIAPRVEMVSDEVRDRVKSEKSLKSAKAEIDEVVGVGREANLPLWSRLAICFERTGRRIQVSGVAIEWESDTAPTK